MDWSVFEKLQDEGTSDLNTHHYQESYLHRLLQIVDYCAMFVLNQIKVTMMGAVHNAKRFEEPALNQLRQKIIHSLTEDPYMSPLANITKTVMDKTGETPDIMNLSQLIKEEMNHQVLIVLNTITDADDHLL